MRRKVILFVIAALGASLLVAPPQAAAEPASPPGTTVFVGELSTDQLRQVVGLGLDRGSLITRGRAGDRIRTEVVLTRYQADKLNALGVSLAEKRVDGTDVSRRMSQKSTSGYNVFRSWSEPGGLRDELIALSKQYPRLTKLVTIGRSVKGQDILALKVTRDAQGLRDGSRPAVLYSSAQHAREWITPEMTRRLLRYYLESYGTTRPCVVSSIRGSCGSCRWPTRMATTTPSPRAIGCGERTCGTTTATVCSAASTASI